MALLNVENLKTAFHTRNGIVRAVDGVSFSVARGETLGIVGESGSGKSVTFYSLLGLLPMPPGRIESGSAMFDKTELLGISSPALRAIRGKRISMIFQDPMTALNPYMTIGKQLMEPLLQHKICPKPEARDRALAELNAVGIQDGEKRLNMYPHEFSGGMRQRVMIAMALITRPDVLIADEPTTALDVTVQAQILALLRARQDELGMALVLITHDLGVIAGMCDHVAVMYAGRILERGPTRAIFYHSRHPYTQALLNAIPATHERAEILYTIPGLPPDLIAPIPGCPFAPRCEHVHDACRTAPCILKEDQKGHAAACILDQESVGKTP
jgi:oligopeptide transport system ATP-binding protein